MSPRPTRFRHGVKCEQGGDLAKGNIIPILYPIDIAI
jgi:hypothetical protein